MSSATRLAWPLVLLVLLSATPAAARAADPQGEGTVRPADSCPALFGTEAVEVANRERRARLLPTVAIDGDEVLLVHSTDWEESRPLTLAGLKLLETVREGYGATAVGLVRVAATATPSGCSPGVYAVAAGDLLGDFVRVLAVLEGLVLVEYAEGLYFVREPETETPIWFMVWRSPWKVPKPDVFQTAKPTRRSKGRRNKRRRGRRR